MCYTFQERCVTVLVKKTKRACQEYNVKTLVLAGGVAANSYLREKMQEMCTKEGIKFSYPEIIHCTDNAASGQIASNSLRVGIPDAKKD